jgi:subfamily B ATP-binding cassette protein MsbA
LVNGLKRAFVFLGQWFWGGKELFATLTHVARLLAAYRTLLVFGILFMVGYTVFTAAPAWYIKDLVDALEKGIIPPLEKFFLVAFGIVLIFSLRGLFFFGHNYLIGVMGQRMVADLRMTLYRHLLRLSFSFFTSRPAGDVIARFTSDLLTLRQSISMSITGPLRDVPQMLIFLGILFHRSWHLALVSLAMMPIALWMIRRFGKRSAHLSVLRQESQGELTELLVEAVHGIRVVKAFGMEKYEEDRFARANAELLHRQNRSVRITSYSPPMLETLGAIAAAGIFMLGGFLIIRRVITTGDFASFIFAFFLLSDPIKKLNGFSLKVHEGLACARRIFDLLEIEPEVDDRPGATELDPIKKGISIHIRRFSYPGKEAIALQDISVEVKRGEVIALVGSSGAGKTSFVNLIPRYFDLQDGEILIDGTDIHDVTLRSLRAQIAIVTQEIFLFHDTVAANIAYGKIDCPHERIVDAAKAANAHEFIEALPMGYHTVIGSGGMQLSGGQRQRLSIARALIKNAPILILDEATSALDSESEIEVQQAIERILENRTTFVIAHRLSTIRQATRIYVLDHGRIVESGRHEELLQRGGSYKRLYEMQFRHVLPLDKPRFPWQRWWSRERGDETPPAGPVAKSG